MENKEIKIEEGSIAFWIKENSINFSDESIVKFFQIDPEGGSIFCVKDGDQKIKVFFVVLGKGRVDVEYNAKELSSKIRHMIAFTWSLTAKELNLYIDGQKVVTQKISF